jgi:hypothetical protein
LAKPSAAPFTPSAAETLETKAASAATITEDLMVVECSKKKWLAKSICLNQAEYMSQKQTVYNEWKNCRMKYRSLASGAGSISVYATL